LKILLQKTSITPPHFIRVPDPIVKNKKYYAVVTAPKPNSKKQKISPKPNSKILHGSNTMCVGAVTHTVLLPCSILLLGFGAVTHIVLLPCSILLLCFGAVTTV
jgi:hypothetical protein